MKSVAHIIIQGNPDSAQNECLQQSSGQGWHCNWWRKTKPSSDLVISKIFGLFVEKNNLLTLQKGHW